MFTPSANWSPWSTSSKNDRNCQMGTVRHVWFLPLWLCSDLGKGMEVTEGAANRTAGGAFFSTLCMKGKEHDTPLRFFLFEFYELYFVLFWTHWWNPHVTRYEFSDPEHLHCDPATWRWNPPWNWADQIVRSSIVLGQRWRLIPARYHCKVGVCRWVHPNPQVAPVWSSLALPAFSRNNPQHLPFTFHFHSIYCHFFHPGVIEPQGNSPTMESATAELDGNSVQLGSTWLTVGSSLILSDQLCEGGDIVVYVGYPNMFWVSWDESRLKLK